MDPFFFSTVKKKGWAQLFFFSTVKKKVGLPGAPGPGPASREASWPEPPGWPGWPGQAWLAWPGWAGQDDLAQSTLARQT